MNNLSEVQKQILDKVKENHNKYIIYVNDQGIGISHKNIANIFKSIPIIDTKKETSYKASTGQGLVICKSILNELNGQLFISSKIGKGSIFRIELPK